MAAPRTSTRRHGAVAFSVMLTVGGLVSGLGVASATRGAVTDTTASVRPVAFAARTDGVLNLDLRPVTRRAAIARCLTPGFATRPAQVSVLNGVLRQKLPRGSVAVLILRNRAGTVRLCDQFGVTTSRSSRHRGRPGRSPWCSTPPAGGTGTASRPRSGCAGSR